MHSPRSRQLLDGEWALALDPGDAGLAGGWSSGDNLPDPITVTVPSVWDRWVPDYDGVGWYRRTFDAAPELADRHAELRFEGVDYVAEVWLNGTRLGAHEGGHTPFSFDVTTALRPSGNVLVVRVIDPDGPEGYKQYLPKQIPGAKQRGYFSYGGIWGSVWLEGMDPAHITDLFVRPDLRRNRIEADVTASQDLAVRVRIAETAHAAEAGSPGTLTLDFPDYQPWTPDSPVLYTLECELLRDGEPVDRVDIRFGMREFTVKDGRFCLNNRPVFVKGVLLQPDYPGSLVAPPDDAMARRELELAKEAGFNMVRLHIKTAPKRTLELCDELGLLVYAEPPIGWIQNSEHMRERCEGEVREMILRDRNHACIVIWGMLNESGNCHYVVRGGAQLIKDDLCRLARSLDPTRLIIDDSGGTNSTRESARLMRPYHSELVPYEDLHIYQRGPVDDEIARYFRHNGNPDTLCFLSEFGFGGLEDLEAVVRGYGDAAQYLKDARFLARLAEQITRGFHERDLDRVFGSFAGFAAAAQELQADALRHQTDACRQNSKMAGYCYTQLCDAGHEVCAGILDHWRNPKPAWKAFKEIQQPLRPVIQLQETNLTPRQEVEVAVTLINDARNESNADLSLQVVGPTGQVLWKKKRGIKMPRSSREIWRGSISASGSPGVHKFIVRLMQGMKILGQSEAELYVHVPAMACDVPVEVIDPLGEWGERCTELARATERRPQVYILPPLANTVRAYPGDALARMLAEVAEGAVALVFGPPDDWNDLAAELDPSLTATSKDAVGAFMGIYHYIKLHPVFDHIPSRCLMRQPYRNVVPPKTFLEKSDEDICGTFDTAPASSGEYMIEDTAWWGSDILVRRYGTGRIVFTHLRVLENLGHDPVADRIYVNMLRHFGLRSVPAKTEPSPDQKALDWIQARRVSDIRRWAVIGMFPNWNEEGHNTAYPPESTFDPLGVYPGWYKAISWKRWHTKSSEGHLLNLQEALSPVYQYYPRFDRGTAYAYAEFNCMDRVSAQLALQIQDATKVWLNGRLVFEADVHLPHKELKPELAPVTLKHGKNTLMVKVSKIPGEFRFALDVQSLEGEPLPVSWWR
jgi:beta-galactosidase